MFCRVSQCRKGPRGEKQINEPSNRRIHLGEDLSPGPQVQGELSRFRQARTESGFVTQSPHLERKIKCLPLWVGVTIKKKCIEIYDSAWRR